MGSGEKDLQQQVPKGRLSGSKEAHRRKESGEDEGPAGPSEQARASPISPRFERSEYLG
jgi:hypothetical protein